MEDSNFKKLSKLFGEYEDLEFESFQLFDQCIRYGFEINIDNIFFDGYFDCSIGGVFFKTEPTFCQLIQKYTYCHFGFFHLQRNKTDMPVFFEDDTYCIDIYSNDEFLLNIEDTFRNLDKIYNEYDIIKKNHITSLGMVKIDKINKNKNLKFIIKLVKESEKRKKLINDVHLYDNRVYVEEKTNWNRDWHKNLKAGFNEAKNDDQFRVMLSRFELFDKIDGDSVDEKLLYFLEQKPRQMFGIKNLIHVTLIGEFLLRTDWSNEMLIEGECFHISDKIKRHKDFQEKCRSFLKKYNHET